MKKNNDCFMKKIIFAGLVISATFMTSCGGDAPTSGDPAKADSTAVSTEMDLTGLREFDLSPYDLNAIIYVPEKYYTNEMQEQKFVEPEIDHNDGEAFWIITMPGEKYFNIEIEDWGTTEQSLATEKTDHLDKGNIYDFNYTEEGADYMVFQRLLKSENTTLSKEDLNAMPNYHFYCVKNIDNSFITIKTNPMEDYRLPSVKQMLNCARGMKSSK
jgi:hypothetical protein